jgi:hypothetical protein
LAFEVREAAGRLDKLDDISKDESSATYHSVASDLKGIADQLEMVSFDGLNESFKVCRVSTASYDMIDHFVRTWGPRLVDDVIDLCLTTRHVDDVLEPLHGRIESYVFGMKQERIRSPSWID